MKTQFVDSFIDGSINPEVRHASPEAAHQYAIELTTRRRSECRVLGAYDEVIAVYVDGKPVTEAVAA